MATHFKDRYEYIVNNRFVMIKTQHNIMANKKICVNDKNDDKIL